eukprot:NODE_4292_length_325_cov_4.152174_g4210_i0.p3 GENE.NODE_4292_length_325_cov_4.152174_g4210_i0~~NODE_4292_length_325_cov_4.152174_g4210_i0.p3  ORF type:complete len:52 (+),score=7.09 NODE_4292_length_325_cov_4.152174_g4210_i0:81-236(+)
MVDREDITFAAHIVEVDPYTLRHQVVTAGLQFTLSHQDPYKTHYKTPIRHV